MVIVEGRPDGWEQYIENYISKTNKNSFYLLGISQKLIGQYRYSFASPKSINSLKKLIKSTLSKHEYGNEKKLNRISDKRIPSRNEDDL